ncbi:MAG: 4-aminobutyrate aminotransferase [Pseudomonadota bacterium]|jgi:4-aminobutyrate aminotransferase/(S)-3-amino-2-methylpropionate transaminase
MGTKNNVLLERRKNAVPRGVSTAHPVFVSHAKNAELWDVEGNRYIDFAGGIGVQNFGHCHPDVVAAITAQASKVIHSAFQVTAYEPYIELAEEMNRRAPINGPVKTIFFSTGAEAGENAVKISRAATKRAGVISFIGGFHGRSLLAMTLTGKVLPYKKTFGPMAGSVFHAPFPMEYHGVSVDDAIHGIERIFKASIDPSEVAAIMFETVQGEGGFYQAPLDFIKRIREICDKHGILMIADEVQCGFGRTGKLFAIEHSGVKPDIIVTAKSIAGGLPLSAVIGRAEVMDAPEPGGLGGTYAGNPVACAAGLAILKLMDREKLLERSVHLGEKLKARIASLAASGKFPFIGEVRGIGGMVAFELVKDQASHEPAPELAKQLTGIALTQGLILLSCGVYANTIRILVPITAEDAIIDEALTLLERSLKELPGAK